MTGKLPDVTDANFQADVLDADDARSSSTSGLPGAGRAASSTRSSRRWRPSATELHDRQPQRRRQPADRRPLRGALDPDPDPVPATAPRRSGSSARCRSAASRPSSSRPSSESMRALLACAHRSLIAWPARPRCVAGLRRQRARREDRSRSATTSSARRASRSRKGDKVKFKWIGERRAQRRQEEGPRWRASASGDDRSDRLQLQAQVQEGRDVQDHLHGPRGHEDEGQGQLTVGPAPQPVSIPIRSSRPSIVAAAASPPPS